MPRLPRIAVLAGLGALVALVMWLGIWACFRFRYSMLAPLPADASQQERADYARTQASVETSRARTLLGEHGGDPTGAAGTGATGFAPALLRFADAQHLLPESYLLGFAQTLAWSANRRAYLMGEYSGTGWSA